MADLSFSYKKKGEKNRRSTIIGSRPTSRRTSEVSSMFSLEPADEKLKQTLLEFANQSDDPLAKKTFLKEVQNEIRKSARRDEEEEESGFQLSSVNSSSPKPSPSPNKKSKKEPEEQLTHSPKQKQPEQNAQKKQQKQQKQELQQQQQLQKQQRQEELQQQEEISRLVKKKKLLLYLIKTYTEEQKKWADVRDHFRQKEEVKSYPSEEEEIKRTSFTDEDKVFSSLSDFNNKVCIDSVKTFCSMFLPIVQFTDYFLHQLENLSATLSLVKQSGKSDDEYISVFSKKFNQETFSSFSDINNPMKLIEGLTREPY